MRTLFVMLATMFMVAMAVAPAEAKPETGEALLATGELYSLEGKPIVGARVTAYIVDESNLEKGIVWSPIASTKTEKGGRFEVRVNTTLERASVDELGQVRVAFVATDGTSTTMFEEGFLADEARDGRWVVYTEKVSQDASGTQKNDSVTSSGDRMPVEADELLVPNLTTKEEIRNSAKSESVDAVEGYPVDTTRPVLGDQWVNAVRGNRTLGTASGTEGLRLEMAMDVGRPSEGAAKASDPDGQMCADLFYGDWWLWELNWFNEWDSLEWVSTGLVRTRFSGAGYEFDTKHQTKSSILLRFGTSYGGSLGYSQSSGSGWGGYFAFSSWRRQEPRLQAHFGDFRMYCLNAYDPNPTNLWTNVTQTKMITWTGGTQRYWTNRSFYCPSNSSRRTTHGSDMWITRYETRYMSAGVNLKGFSMNSKQQTDSGVKTTHFWPNSTYTLCGSDHWAIYADHAMEV